MGNKLVLSPRHLKAFLRNLLTPLLTAVKTKHPVATSDGRCSESCIGIKGPHVRELHQTFVSPLILSPVEIRQEPGHGPSSPSVIT